jgi:hypothetical protein
MNRSIEIVVSPMGETTLQTKGYEGAACLEASRFLERALGIVVQEQRTPEYYARAVEDQHVRQ